MADLKDLKGLAEGASTQAALHAGKEMAKRAIEDLTLSDDEKKARDEARAGDRKKTLIKLGVVGVVGVVVVLSVMSLLAKLWMYGIGLLIVAGIGGAGYLVLKPKVVALKAKATARLNARNAADAEAAAAKAVVDAEAAKKKKLDDELAALKKRA